MTDEKPKAKIGCNGEMPEPGPTTGERKRITELERENRDLGQADEILRHASVETINRLSKAEVIRRRPEPIGNIPPPEAEARRRAGRRPTPNRILNHQPRPLGIPRFTRR